MKKAFTLIELLVVIAIIAILAAILFPVFAQAKLAAKKTSSLSGLKQVALGLQIYSNDFDDVAVPDYGYSDGSIPGDTNIYHYTTTWVGRTLPYVKSKDIYFDTLLGKPDFSKVYQDPYYPTYTSYTYSWSWITTFSLNVDGYSHSYSGTGPCGTSASGGYRSLTSFPDTAKRLAVTPTRYGAIPNFSWLRFQSIYASRPVFDTYANTFSWYALVADAQKQYNKSFIGAFADGHAGKYGPEKFVKKFANAPANNEWSTTASWCSAMTSRDLWDFWGDAYKDN